MIASTLGLVALAGAIAGAPGGVAWEDCTLESPGMPRVEARCGSVVVSARDATGKPVQLPIGFAVLAATSERQKAAEPLVILPGGPGQSGTEMAGLIGRALAKVRRDRDIVLFDPRGTGRSLKLACEDERSIAEKLRATDEEEAERLAACARTLPLDPKEITTGHVTRDLEAVREALGAAQWHLLGVSYGTRVALAYDRAFPGRARSLVLDGVVPLSMRVGERAAEDARAALVALDARCKAAPGCAPVGADGTPRSLVDVVRDLRTRLDAAPADVTLPHPVTAVPVTLRIDGDAAAGVVRLLVYAEETAAILPPILGAAAQGDLAPLAAQLVLAERLEDSISQPMQLSVLCAEDLAHLPATASTPSGADAVFPDVVSEMKRACAVWPHADVPASFHDDAPASQTPALLLSGSADPVTPPSYGEAARRTLPNSVHVVGTGLGHNLTYRGCVPDVIAKFLAGDEGGAPDPAALDVACTRRLAPFPVFIDNLGPAP